MLSKIGNLANLIRFLERFELSTLSRFSLSAKIAETQPWLITLFSSLNNHLAKFF
jgi:hypothetical protein